MITLSALIAIAFGAFLAVAEVVRNWGDWEPWPWWVVDYIAVALLLYGGRAALPSRPQRNATPLGGAWGFACAMFYGSFFSHLESLHEKGTGPIDSVSLTMTIGVLFAVTILGLALAIVGSRRELSGAPRMILEVAVLDVRAGESAHFELAFEEAQRIIASMPGYQRHELRRCVEATSRYLLLVWWNTLEDHTVGFRGSPEYQRWKALLHRFYDPFPTVEHYTPLFGSER